MDYILKSQFDLNRIYQNLALRESLLPIKITATYAKKIAEEAAVLGHHDGPLSLCVLPSKERITLRAPGEVNDFVEDRSNMLQGLADISVQKYRDRLLYFPTDVCAAHCQYCFRQDVLSELHEPGKAKNRTEDTIPRMVAYLRENPAVNEVILSGGDPLTLSVERLEAVLHALKEDAGVAHIRLHTRTIVFAPRVLRPRIVALLVRYNVRLVFHIVHPYEVCSEVRDIIRRLRQADLRLYNQFPILRKINDHSEVLRRHLVQLDDLGVRNLSMFIPDPIHYSASFRIPLERLFGLIDELNWSTPSWVNATRLVLDTPIGKVRREDLRSLENGQAVFVREGNEIRYTDFPSNLDEPGDLRTLLWKEKSS